ncbi:MAG TPA: histidinol dehydrogenase, partial [Thermoanaerobaculia bacterium]
MIKIVDAEARSGKKELENLLKSRRGGSPDFATLKQVLPIVEDVLRRGEPALREYIERFDLEVPRARGSKRTISLKGEEGNRQILLDPRREKSARIDPEFAGAFRVARRRIEAYHRKQLLCVSQGFSFKDSLGVSFAERPVPFDSVGVYVPGGRAFYPSSLLMGVVPARIAGVRRIVVATPRGAWAGSPELRWAAAELGVDEVLLAGGAHGIAGLVSVSGVA